MMHGQRNIKSLIGVHFKTLCGNGGLKSPIKKQSWN